MTETPPKPVPLDQLKLDKARSFLPREGSKRAYKPQGLGSLMPKLTRKVAGKRPTLLSDIKANWEAIVGAEVAALTRPQKLSAKTLHLDAAAGAGPILAMRQQNILAQVDLHLGAGKVERLRLHQVENFAPQAVKPTKSQDFVNSDQESFTSSVEGLSDSDKSSKLSAAMERLRQRLDEV